MEEENIALKAQLGQKEETKKETIVQVQKKGGSLSFWNSVSEQVDWSNKVIDTKIKVIDTMIEEKTQKEESKKEPLIQVQSKPQNLTIPLTSNLNLEMVYVEGGTFEMGYKKGRDGEDKYMDTAKPLHQVSLDSFHIGKFNITQAQYQAIMGTNPSHFKGEKLPVEQVSWQDTQVFIKKLNEKTGKKFRLPTEAEWEYAARGGNQSKGFMYAGSNNLDEVAWYGENSEMKTHEVGLKKHNELGIYDMSGNLWEWCSNWYDTYPTAFQTNPKGAETGTYRVRRGGGWNLSAVTLRVAFRGYYTPTYGDNRLGFRLVCL